MRRYRFRLARAMSERPIAEDEFFIVAHADAVLGTQGSGYLEDGARQVRSASDGRRTGNFWRETPCPASRVRGVDDGVPEELALFGNAVVPQCAEVVGWVVRELLEVSP